MIRLENSPGIEVRNPSRTYLRADVAAVVRGAGQVLAAEGLKVKLGDGSREGGGVFPPHVSHRDGTDLDVFPVGGGGASVDYAVGRFLHILGPSLELVGSTLPVTANGTRWAKWPNHYAHVHLRWPRARLSGRLATTINRAVKSRSRTLFARVRDQSRMGLLALNGATGGSAAERATARAALRALSDDNADAVDQQETAATAVRSLAAVLGDLRIEHTPALKALATMNLNDVAEQVTAKEPEKKPVSSSLGLLSFFGIAALLAILVAVGSAFWTRPKSPIDDVEDLSDTDIRKIYRRVLEMPPGKKSRASMVASILDVDEGAFEDYRRERET